MIELVISGGQSGADQAAWRAAQAFDVRTGGWMPGGFLTEDGPWPEFAAWYGAREHASAKYPPRTFANIHMADATVIFTGRVGPGTALTIRAAADSGRPFLHVDRGDVDWSIPPVGDDGLAGWLARTDPRILNVAGTRESGRRGFGILVETYLRRTFRDLFGNKK